MGITEGRDIMPQKTLSKLMADTEKIKDKTERIMTILLVLPEEHKEHVIQYLEALLKTVDFEEQAL
jgi:hypothetical protein